MVINEPIGSFEVTVSVAGAVVTGGVTVTLVDFEPLPLSVEPPADAGFKPCSFWQPANAHAMISMVLVINFFISVIFKR